MGYQIYIILQRIIRFHSFILNKLLEIKKSFNKIILKRLQLEFKSSPTQKVKKKTG